MDDEPFIREMLAKLLGMSGYGSRVASGYESALDSCREFRPDMVLADIRMPGGSGFDLARQLRKSFPDMLIVGMTGYGSHADACEALRLQLNDYVLKPFENEQLLQSIERTLDQRPVPRTISDLTAFQQWFEAVDSKGNAKPAARHFRLEEAAASVADLKELFRLAVEILPLAGHDVNGALFGAFGTGKLCQIRLDEITSLVRTGAPSAAVLEACERTRLNLASHLDYLQEAARLMRTYTTAFRTGDYSDVFVTKPADVVKTIQTSSTAGILIARSNDLSLEIVFPENVFSGVLAELIQNAVKHTRKNCRVAITWNLSNKRFRCEVHDDGAGMFPDGTTSFVPADALPHKNSDRNHGLGILARLLFRANGLLLFSRSQILGGTVAVFEFPVVGHYTEIK